MTGNVRFPYYLFMTIETAVKKIREFYLEQKRLPSYNELAQVLGFSSKKTSFTWAKKLIDEGFLGKDGKGKLFPKGLFAVPMLGTIRAGVPSMAEHTLDESLDLYEYLLDMPGGIFSLKVRGDSMKEEGINEDDIVIVEKGREPIKGDVVAACVDGEWTVKYFFRDKASQVILIPANPKYKNIYPKESLLIGGVVISVIRKYH